MKKISLLNFIIIGIAFFSCDKDDSGTEPDPLTLTYNVIPVSVSEESDGAIDITVSGGITPYSYYWSNGATTEDLDSIKTGTYTVTVTDSNNQSVLESIKVTKQDDFITIGIYTDNGAQQGCYIAAENMFRWMGHRIKRIKADDVNSGNISDIDLIYFPGGSTGPYRQDINETGRNNIKKLVSDGGSYIGTCAGALYACESNIWEEYSQTDGFLGIFAGVGIGPIPEIFEYPEIGMCRINLEKPHPITDSEDDAIWIMYYNGPYFIANDNANIEIIGRYDISNHPAIVANDYGNGRVFLTGPHPEWEEDDDRDGVSYFDNYDDHESDWPLMKAAVLWCLKENN